MVTRRWPLHRRVERLGLPGHLFEAGAQCGACGGDWSPPRAVGSVASASGPAGRSEPAYILSDVVDGSSGRRLSCDAVFSGTRRAVRNQPTVSKVATTATTINRMVIRTEYPAAGHVMHRHSGAGRPWRHLAILLGRRALLSVVTVDDWRCSAVPRKAARMTAAVLLRSSR